MSVERFDFQELTSAPEDEYYAIRSELSELRIDANLALFAGNPVEDTSRIDELSARARELAESANDIVIQ